MKESQLLTILKKYLNTEVRKIVREEVSYLNKEIREVVREEIELSGAVKMEEKSTTQLSDLIENEQPKRKIKKRNPITYSNNLMLNNILSETTSLKNYEQGQYPALSGRQGENEEWETVGGVRTSDQVHEPINSSIINKNKSVTANEIIPRDRKGRDIPEFLEKVFEKDYRPLTSKMKQSKSNATNGLIPKPNFDNMNFENE